ncbi:MAG TPA: family 10 glycosylhydrolase, partial [Planctomycetaceae bacterium]|nr:family 10 glycosylhydrolase [Planctomycetaceae bacterium]
MGFSRSSIGRVPTGRWFGIGPIGAAPGLVLKTLLFATGALFLSAAPNEAHRVVRLRFEWKCDKAECWAGVLETSQGTIAEPASLGVDENEAGTLLADGKSLWLGRRKPRDRDGFEVSVIAPPAAHLSFTLQAAVAGGVRQRFECLLSDLEGESKSLSAKNNGLQLSVRRAPGDALRVVVDHPNLIYHPGETFKARLIPDVLAATRLAQGAKLKWSLCATRNGETLKLGSLPLGKKSAAVHDAQDGVRIEIPLPSDEGAVSLHFRLVGNGPSEPRSSVHLLVLGEHAPPVAQVRRPTETLIDRLSSADIQSKRRLEPSQLRLPGRAHDAQFAVSPLEIVEPAVEHEPRVDWIAVRLRLKHPQRPHRLVLHVAENSGSFLGASLFEPDARGELSGQTLDTGLALASGEASEEPSPSAAASPRHEILFWPQVSDPVLLLHDLGAGRRPQVTGVEVYEWAPKRALKRNVAASTEERLIGPYLAKLMLPENFGGPKVFDERAGQCVDDWETFHAAAMHAADYLIDNGYNSLLLAALADGVTIYPSNCIEPTRRYDSGAVSSAGQRPIRKDFLELLYRVFDREQLRLIPELQFTCPLPALERQLVDGAAAEGIELIGADGQSARDHGSQSPTSQPDYNPLDPRVQDAVIAAVREVVQRYQHHPSFHGVALEVSRTGYLQLPGLDWGYDSTTVRRFEHDTGITVDGAAGGDIFHHRHAVLAGEARAAWIRWRCQELAKFYRRLADTLAAAAPHARLILACKQMLADPGADEEIRHEVRTRGRLGELLAARGIDFSLLNDSPRLVVLKSAVWRASASVEESLLDEALSQTSSFGTTFRLPNVGVLDYRPPRCLKVADFDPLSPWRPAQTRITVAASPGVRESRRRFVRGLAETDSQMMFDGGWTAPLGQEHATEALRRIARSIPPIPFYKVEGQNQSATIHVARHNKKTYIYAVNAFAQPCELSLQLSCPARTTCRPLGPSAALTEDSNGAGGDGAGGDETSRLKTSLDGYGLAAWV